MNFVDKKIIFLTLGDLGSSLAVSSKLPIAINESALYPLVHCSRTVGWLAACGHQEGIKVVASQQLRIYSVASYRDRQNEKALAFENSPWSQRGRLDLS